MHDTASVSMYVNCREDQDGICRGDGGHVLVSEFRGMALNGLFCAEVLTATRSRPPLTLPTNTILEKTDGFKRGTCFAEHGVRTH